MLHMTQILIFISYFDKETCFFAQNLTLNAFFTIGVPEKNAFLGSCHRYQEIHILPVEPKKKLHSMSISKLKQSVFWKN